MTAILYTTWEQAREIRDEIRPRHPGARVVEYQKGHAIQLRKSGAYILRPTGKQDVPTYVEPFDVQADWEERF